MAVLTIEFDNQLGDHLEAERVYYRSTFWWRVDKVVGALLAAFGAFLLFAPARVTPARVWAPSFLVLAVLEWFNLLSVRPLVIRSWYKRNPKFRERYRLTFSDAGLHFQTESIDAQVAWSHYSKVLASDAVILLVYGTRMYSVIPTRVFSDATERAAFMALVRRHIPQHGQRDPDDASRRRAP